MHLGLIGYGSIATNLIELLSPTQVTAITVLTRTHTIPDIPSNMPNLRFVTNLQEFVDRMPDLVVECAGHSAVSQYVPTLLDAHIDVILASVGALADDALHQKLKAAASNGASRFTDKQCRSDISRDQTSTFVDGHPRRGYFGVIQPHRTHNVLQRVRTKRRPDISQKCECCGCFSPCGWWV